MPMRLIAAGALAFRALACAAGESGADSAAGGDTAAVAGDTATRRGGGDQAGSVLAGYALDPDRAERIELPGSLREVSGLATSEDGRLFGHNDERGVISEINPADGKIVKAFSLGQPALRADFEGLAIAGGRFYLITSDGDIHEAREGPSGARVEYVLHSTGLGRQCEIEGLAHDPRRGALLVACKEARAPAVEGTITVFAWSIERKAVMPDATIRTPLAPIAGRLNDGRFRATAIERHPGTGHLILISSPDQALVELTPAGEVAAVRRLPDKGHRQPEGLAFGQNGALIVSDEGSEKGEGTLTMYSRGR
jgi:uncharacterized protein YjiK